MTHRTEMQRRTITVVGLGLLFATPHLKAQERSYGATKEAVWSAVLEAFSALQIAVTKEDKDKGQIQSDSAATDSTYLQCELHVGRGRPPETLLFMPKARLDISLRQRSATETSVHIKFAGKKVDVSSGGFIGQMVCKSTGRLEETILGQVESRLAAQNGRP